MLAAANDLRFGSGVRRRTVGIFRATESISVGDRQPELQLQQRRRHADLHESHSGRIQHHVPGSGSRLRRYRRGRQRAGDRAPAVLSLQSDDLGSGGKRPQGGRPLLQSLRRPRQRDVRRLLPPDGQSRERSGDAARLRLEHSVQAPTIPGSILIHPLYSFNSLGGTNTVEQLGTGWYRVLMPGMSSTTKGGNVMVSAYDAVNGQMRYCKVAFWNSFSRQFDPGGSGGLLRARWKSGGQPLHAVLRPQHPEQDRLVRLSLERDAVSCAELHAQPLDQAVLANRSSNTATYLPSALPSGNITITQGIPGFYTVTAPR